MLLVHTAMCRTRENLLAVVLLPLKLNLLQPTILLPALALPLTQTRSPARAQSSSLSMSEEASTINSLSTTMTGL